MPDQIVEACGVVLYIVGVVQVLADADLPSFETYFVYPEGAKASKRISVFRDFLVAKAREWSF